MHGTGEELADALVAAEESKVSENPRTVVNRVKVQGLWLAKKIYKYSDREQGEREIYLQEVKILRLLIRKPHWHVILLLHHYEDPRGRGCLILSPLAQTTLEAFLSQSPNQERKTLVGPWIGCLASGLAHIHAQRVKHKDIKPSNILIHGTNPIIADMGISHRFDNDSKSSGRSAGSLMYEAPEVIEEQVRGRRQDVWSMLCCYIEILAFQKDIDRKTFQKSIRLGIYFYKYDFVANWLNSLKPGAVDEEELAFVQLLLDSFKRDAEERPYALDLVEQIQAICKQRPYKYIGECCVLDDTVNISSNLVPAVTGTASTLPNPEDLEQGSLLHFVASTSLSLGKSDIPEAYPSLYTLYLQVSSRAIRSIRSAEKKFLLTIAPVRLLSHSRPALLLTRPLEILQRRQNLSVSQQWLY
jgi:serine/threonine protein kinase